MSSSESVVTQLRSTPIISVYPSPCYCYFFFGPLNNNCRQESARARARVCVLQATNNEHQSWWLTSLHFTRSRRSVKYIMPVASWCLARVRHLEGKLHFIQQTKQKRKWTREIRKGKSRWETQLTDGRKLTVCLLKFIYTSSTPRSPLWIHAECNGVTVGREWKGEKERVKPP